jgi:hypothetical protein
MPIYNLFLSCSLPSTANGYKDDSVIIAGYRMGDPASTSTQFYYNINWDKLFKGENYNEKYTKCKFRYKMLNGNTNTSLGTFNNMTGVLNANFQSLNYLPGTTISVPIGLYYPIFPPTGGTNKVLVQNTLDSLCGIEIEIPKGSSMLDICYSTFDRTAPVFLSVTNAVLPFYLFTFELI